MPMKRRQFITSAGLAGFGATALARPALAQAMPELHWRLTSSFPRSLDLLYGGGETFAKAVAEATDNRFQIQTFAAGEIVPSVQALEAVQNGTVEMCQTAMYYYWNKDPTFALATGVPFGMNARETNAWLYHGGGNDLLNEFFKEYQVFALPAGNTGCQMGGWFRKELKSLADVNSLKFRIGGFAGAVLQRLGGTPEPLAAAEIYSALEKGTIDAADYLGPYDDEKLSFNKIAPYYYYPGWWAGGSTLHIAISANKWAELPKPYQAIITAAAALANVDVLARYDAKNPAALKRLVATGSQLRPFPQDVMEASYKAAVDIFQELSDGNANFKKVHDAYMTFRNDQYLWWQVAEYSYDNFLIRQRAKG
jgi:TRAP-type mannitol/chloroaromatic compound transport system substrate-binding protein